MALTELSTSALDERTGAMMWSLLVMCLPSMKMSCRSTCGLYDVQLRDSPPSKWFWYFFQLDCWGRWQPKQLVTHEVWQV